MDKNRCIFCDDIIPEGRMVCPQCDNNFNKNVSNLIKNSTFNSSEDFNNYEEKHTMSFERFNELLDELDGTSLKTLKEKNAKYSRNNDALHNFRVGASLDCSTMAQTAWHYMKKHMVALLDKIEHDDFSDKEDVKEKIQDIINYLRFIWCIANDE